MTTATIARPAVAARDVAATWLATRDDADAAGIAPHVASALALEVLADPRCSKCRRRILDDVREDDPDARLLCAACRGWSRCIGPNAKTPCAGDERAPYGRQWCGNCADAWFERGREIAEGRVR